MKPLKIALVGWAGSVHVQRWATGLSKRGYDIRVVSLGGGPIEGVDTKIIERTGRLSYLTRKSEAVEQIRQFQPDIVHAHYATGNGWWGVASGVRPLVVSVWGSDVVSFPKSFVTRAISKSILNNADRICATSDLLKRVVAELAPEAEEKTRVIPFGVAIPDHPPEYPSGDTFRICFVKALEKIYGPDLLIEAFALALDEVPGMALTIAGSGSMRNELEQQVSWLGISDSVKFVGQIDYAKVYPLIKEHHLMVMPSRSESFGVAALEASACARPVIATNVGGIPEVVQDEKSGILVPPDDPLALSEAIKKLARDQIQGQQFGLNGYRMVQERFSWESSLDQMSALYQSLV